MARLKEPDVIVVGAGIGGLTAALAMMQRGLSVVLLEQSVSLREVGAGVQLSPNGTRALASLGLLDGLEAIAVEPEGKQIRLWSTGQSWPLFDLGSQCRATYGYPYLMVHRGDLQSLLARAVSEASAEGIRLGARVADLDVGERRVSVRLADGQTVSAPILIGADGIHSVVRSALFGTAGAKFTGCMAWRGVVPAERLPPELRRRSGVNWVGPGRHVVTYPLRRGELINFVGVVESDAWSTESWTARGSREECARDFAGWHPEVHALIDAIDEHYRWALLNRVPIDRWSDGRVALLGDACHPMLPFMAQGAAMAIEDAIVIARCLEAFPTDVGGALRAYEAARVARANRCVMAADHNRRLFHDADLTRPEDAERYVAAQWSEGKVGERYEWLFSYDALSCPIDAMAA